MIPRRYLAASALAAIALLVSALLWLTAADQRGGASAVDIDIESASAPVAEGASSGGASTPLVTERVATPRALEGEELAADKLRFAVRHADGAPAPDLALAVRTAPGGSQILHVTTDAHGEAQVADARAAILEAAASALLEVAVLGLLPEPTPLALDPRRCFEEPIEIELPPLTELALRVVRADGSALDYGAAEVMTQASQDGRPPRSFGVQSFPWWLEVEGGGACFRRIQAEVPLFIAVRDAGWGLELVRAHPGLPRGTRTELELRFDTRRGLLRARVIDGASGAPLANAHLQQTWIVVEPERSQTSSRPILTDEGGILFLESTAPKRAVELSLELGDPRRGRVRREVPLDLGSGVHDLGDLVLLPHPARVTGHVLDERGSPLPRAEVDARLVLRDPGDSARVRYEHFAERLYTDEAGRFAWMAPPVCDDPAVEGRVGVALTAYGAQSRSPVIEVPLGAREVELRLERLGGFAGRLAIDPRVPFHVFLIEHRVAGDDGPHAWTRLFAPSADALEVNGLEPGRYDLRVRLQGTLEGAVTTASIEVRAGELTQDPRLDPLDLREAFPVFDFEVAHPPECVPYDLRFTLTRIAGGGELRASGSMVSATRAATLVPPGIYDAVFETPGFHPVVLRGLSAGQRIELVPAHALRLIIDAAEAEGSSGGKLELVLRRTETKQELVRAIEPPCRELLVPLSQPGRYDLVWRRRAGSGGSGTLVPLGAGEPAFLEVSPTAAETVARITPPTAQ